MQHSASGCDIYIFTHHRRSHALNLVVLSNVLSLMQGGRLYTCNPLSVASPPSSRNLSTSLKDCWELATALSRLDSLSNCPAEAIPVRSACKSPPRCNEASSPAGYGFECTSDRLDDSTGARTPWIRGQWTRVRRTATRESHWGQGPQCLDPQAALLISREHLRFGGGLGCVCQKWKTRLAEWTALQRQPTFVQHGVPAGSFAISDAAPDPDAAWEPPLSALYQYCGHQCSVERPCVRHCPSYGAMQ